MRFLAILIPVLAFIGGIYYWSRDPLADVARDAHGFIALTLPGKHDAASVLILTPPPAAAELNQRADALQQALQQENIPSVRDSRYHSDDAEDRRRFYALTRQPGPIVFVGNKACANPPAADVIAAYRAR